MSVEVASAPTPSPAGFAGRGLLTLERVSKRFGTQIVLRELSCSIVPGEVVLLLGSNGAGKSTLLRLCVGLLRADTGRVINTLGARAVGYVGHEPMVYAHLSVSENLELFSSIAGLSPREARAQAAAAIECWRLTAHAGKRISELSRGLQMRVALARTLQMRPSLVCLDEPTSALDEETAAALCAALSGMAAPQSRFGAVVMATHDIERVRGIATRIILLSDGQIMGDSARATAAGVTPQEACEAIIAQYRKRNR
ncbi:MAG: ABC transporter ATP-binding protein [Proteobacteria bacterium]|nr:ABC transporter ATP-binding protein [Pseudomonadota bacterium]